MVARFRIYIRVRVNLIEILEHRHDHLCLQLGVSMEGWDGSGVGWATFITAVASHGWVPLGGITVIVAATYIITLLVLALRADRGFDGIKIKTPFFTFSKEPTKKPKRPRRLS